jgi:hypothetical protein
MEHKSGQRRVLRKVLLICALGVGVLLLPVAAWRIGRYYHVERAAQAFRSSPSQTGADKLVDLLDKRSPTQAQAARILKLLLQPKVVTRSAYPIGRKPTISTLSPFRFRFNTTMTCRMDILADGQDLQTPQFSTFTYVGTGPQVLVSPVAPDRCGKFSMELRLHYALVPPREDRRPYPTNPVGQFVYDLLDRINRRRQSTGSEERPYQVSFRVPVDINVVPETEAEQVQLLSSPELDARMKEGLRPRVSLRGFDQQPLEVRVFARCLPATVVFDCFLELPDGTKIRSSRPENRHLTGYAGQDFELRLWWEEYRVDRFDVPEAKLVFESDPNHAFEEPTIKAIWNGRLKFPNPFRTASDPNAGE